ncbi:branched chain amino acid aminotransferase [Candidatus Micrarchaeota archaeon CG1_02_55_22]|nr:MAG: branched chain amino acid aminotransferase [Candidatus Micrarchaeota archaeon CG1_02_55_22]
MAIEKTEKIWLNGNLVAWDDAKLHVISHGLHYGTGVFEGIRCYNAASGPAVFRLREHMQRLHNSAKIYLMPLPYSVDELCAAVKETVKANKLDSCYIRPIAYYGYGSMGVNPAGNPVDVAIACWPWGAYLGEEGLKKGIRVNVSSWRRIDSAALPGMAKACGNYLNSVLAKQDALQHGFDEAILLNTQGKLAEGSGENIFLVQKGELVTPGLSSSVLDGITRGAIIALANDLGIPVVEREINREELFVADEVFFTGTAAEVTPVREVDGRVIGSGSRGPVTEKIQAAFFDVVNGKNEKYAKWLEKV